MNQTDKLFYILGLILLFSLGLITVLQHTGVLMLTNLGFPCAFRRVTGCCCPGCGGTRAVCALAAGNWKESFLEHPFVPYAAVCFFVFVIRNTPAFFQNRQTGRRTFSVMHFRTAYLYFGIAIILIQWVAKLILL